MKRFSAFVLLMTLLFNNIFYCSAADYLYVNCDALNLRVSPNTSCDIVGKLQNGTKLELIYTDNGWHNVKLENGVTGFVYAQYVSDNLSESSGNLGEQVARTVQKYIGCSYSYGSMGPNSFDCSGLTSYVYGQYGLKLPRTSNSQGSYGSYVDKNNLVAGDLVFFSNRSDRSINHVGIYIGNGNFVHASTSTRGVVMDNLSSTYYVNHYVTARRVA